MSNLVKSFIISFKLKNTYRVNTIIYSIKQFPIIKKLLPNSLYKSKCLKAFGNIISILIEIGSIFIGKLLYILLMIVSLLTLFKTNQVDTFLHIFIFLTICGGLMNTFMFNPSKDKYYALVIMNMDAKSYTLSNYYYAILKVLIGFLPFTLIFGLEVDLPLWICLILPVFIGFVKIIISNLCLLDFKKTGKVRNENIPTKVVWVGVSVLLLLAYGLPYMGFVISQSLFLIFFIIVLVTGIYSLIKINNFKEYSKIYKKILTNDNVYIANKESSTKSLKENVSKQIIYNNITSDKKGFAYFHDLFVKRHQKILTNSARKQMIIIMIILIIAIVAIFVKPEISKQVNSILLMYLPYFVFVMYLLNRGTVVTQAMFMNCDHSMLTYRIYRTPKVILGVFKERLKTLILINLMPALIIALGLPLLLFLTGGTDNILNYIVLFVSIIAMSIFFSVHYLVMYYLLQPYNVNTEMKSSTYSVVQTLTYIVCYYMIEFKLQTIYFGIAMSLFCIIYSIVSLVLVYRLAPKTFKLRI